MSVMIPLSFALVVFFLIILFRRVSGLVYPLLVVTFSLLATLGAMAVLGLPITLVSQIIPSFLMVAGIADSIHILTIFYRRYRNTGDKRRSIIEAIRFAGQAVLETVIDTGQEGGLQEPETLKRFAAATAELPTLSINNIKAAKAWSLADVLKKTNQALHEDQDTAYRGPDSRELIAQELLLF